LLRLRLRFASSVCRDIDDSPLQNLSEASGELWPPQRRTTRRARPPSRFRIHHRRLWGRHARVLSRWAPAFRGPDRSASTMHFFACH